MKIDDLKETFFIRMIKVITLRKGCQLMGALSILAPSQPSNLPVRTQGSNLWGPSKASLLVKGGTARSNLARVSLPQVEHHEHGGLHLHLADHVTSERISCPKKTNQREKPPVRFGRGLYHKKNRRVSARFS